MQVILSILYIIISITTLIILYQAFLKYWKKKHGLQAYFCELVSIEQQPVSGTIDFCFTCDAEKKIDFDICNSTFETITMVASDNFSKGQHILPFDTTSVPDGDYFYRLQSDNQQIFKKIAIKNG